LGYKGIIFDLDMTLVDTSCLEELRSQRLWSKVYSEIKNTTIYEGVPELISELKHYYKVGVVTASPRPYAERVIDYFSLNIPVLSAYHDTKKHKPHSEPIIKGCQVLQLEAEEVISIGDEIKDVIASNSAGVASSYVSWGTNTNLVTNSDFQFKTVREIKEFLI